MFLGDAILSKTATIVGCREARGSPENRLPPRTMRRPEVVGDGSLEYGGVVRAVRVEHGQQTHPWGSRAEVRSPFGRCECNPRPQTPCKESLETAVRIERFVNIRPEASLA